MRIRADRQPNCTASSVEGLATILRGVARPWRYAQPLDRESKKGASFYLYFDPELKAGDLLLVNEHTWHKAPSGTSSEDRCGIFNKYCAVDAPPAAGYYPYSPAALDALSDAGKRLIPVCFDKPITTTRLLIEHPSGQESRYLMLHDDEHDRWELPGGEGWEEEGVGWDIGARIGSLQELTKTQLGCRTSRGCPTSRMLKRKTVSADCTATPMKHCLLTNWPAIGMSGSRKTSYGDSSVRATGSVAPSRPGSAGISFEAKARRSARANGSSSDAHWLTDRPQDSHSWE